MEFTESRLLQGLPKQFFANLVAKVNAKVATGADVINLGQGNPDKPTPEYIVEATQKWVADPATHKYSRFRGLPAFKKAAADFYEEKYGACFNPEKEVAILGGSKIGLVELPWALMNPGDTLLLPDPGYPDYLSGAALGKVKYETYPLKEENYFLPNLNDIPKEVAERAKLIYVNYPNNPTGAVATPGFYEQLVAWAKSTTWGLFLILLMERWVLMVRHRFRLCRPLGLRRLELNFTPTPRHSIWLAGELPLRSVTGTSLRP